MDSSKTLGRTIQRLREEHNMSQEQLAIAIGCSQATVSNYEKGKRRIYLPHIEKLSEIFNTPSSTFLPQNNTAPEPQPETGNRQILNIIQKISYLNDGNLAELEKYLEYLLWRQDKEDLDYEL